MTITTQSSEEYRKQVLMNRRLDKDNKTMRRREKARRLNNKLEEKKVYDWQREWAAKEDEVWDNRRCVVHCIAICVVPNAVNIWYIM